MQKVRRHYLKTISTAYRVTNSNLFHRVNKHTFQKIPLQYFTLSLNLYYLALEDGTPIFRQVHSHRTCAEKFAPQKKVLVKDGLASACLLRLAFNRLA